MNMNADRNRYFRRLLYISSFVISVIPALFYTAPAFEDGLGTMATAAYLTGHDWSTFLAEDGYYYKYGQSLWYILPFLLIDHAVIRYKVMLVINSALTALIPVAAYDISVRYMAVDQSDALWVSALTGLFPSILLYNKYTWAETNLLLIPWLILLLYRCARIRIGCGSSDFNMAKSQCLCESSHGAQYIGGFSEAGDLP